MRSILTLTLALVLSLSAVFPAFAQTAATYKDRAKLTADVSFIGRVTIAALNGAISVVNEDPATPNHAQRLKLSGYVLREPEFVAKRLALLLAATAPAAVDEDGVVATSLTDAQLQAVIDARWTALATALVAQ